MVYVTLPQAFAPATRAAEAATTDEVRIMMDVIDYFLLLVFEWTDAEFGMQIGGCAVRKIVRPA